MAAEGSTLNISRCCIDVPLVFSLFLIGGVVMPLIILHYIVEDMHSKESPFRDHVYPKRRPPPAGAYPKGRGLGRRPKRHGPDRSDSEEFGC